MKSSNSTIPVVILKMEHYGSLGIVRSLGRLGIPVYGVDRDRSAPGFKSRFCAGSFLWDIDDAPAEQTIEYLLEIGNKLGKSILVPTSDEMAILAGDFSELLKEYFIFPQNSSHLIRQVANKKEMYLLAKNYHTPVPWSEFPRSRNDLLLLLQHLQFPLMLKGIDGALLEKRTGKKMLIVRDEHELLTSYDRMEDPHNPNLMLQEYIPGNDDATWMFNGYFNHESECLVEFTGKKIRQNPIHTGMTSLGISVKNDEVARTATAFLKKIGYRGIVDIDYQFDPRDNVYKMLDVNPRVGASFRLFVDDHGSDVVRAFYYDLTGKTIEQVPMREGRKWVVEDKDMRSVVSYFREGGLTIREWLLSYRGIEEAGYFTSYDPLPFFWMVKNHIVRQLRKLFRDDATKHRSDRRSNVQHETESVPIKTEQTKTGVPSRSHSLRRVESDFRGVIVRTLEIDR
ncbi:MAG TPA: hypothetical protein VKS81_05665 [Bacteroidota bacterium]|nr:hypothetical protein [Bacteroidota bacterium]